VRGEGAVGGWTQELGQVTQYTRTKKSHRSNNPQPVGNRTEATRLCPRTVTPRAGGRGTVWGVPVNALTANACSHRPPKDAIIHWTVDAVSEEGLVAR